MRYDWFVEKWKGLEYVDRSPYGMTKSEAESLAKMTGLISGYTLKVVHRNDLHEPA